MLKLGAAKAEAGRAATPVEIVLPEPPASKEKRKAPASFSFSLNKEKLRIVRRREGRYLLRSNLLDGDPAALWQQYMITTRRRYGVEVCRPWRDLVDVVIQIPSDESLGYYLSPLQAECSEADVGKPEGRKIITYRFIGWGKVEPF